MHLQPLCAQYRPLACEVLAQSWGGTQIAIHGELIELADAQGWVALEGDALCGLILYRLQGETCEILSLNSLREGEGIGTALIRQMEQQARMAGCCRMALTTTNDNLPALRFYQRRGFDLARVRPGAANIARKLKPAIPLLGYQGIPIRDELDFVMGLEE